MVAIKKLLDRFKLNKWKLKMIKKIDLNDYVLIPKAMLILLQNCLQRDAEERGTRKEVLEELNKSCVAPEDVQSLMPLQA